MEIIILQRFGFGIILKISGRSSGGGGSGLAAGWLPHCVPSTSPGVLARLAWDLRHLDAEPTETANLLLHHLG